MTTKRSGTSSNPIKQKTAYKNPFGIQEPENTSSKSLFPEVSNVNDPWNAEPVSVPVQSFEQLGQTFPTGNNVMNKTKTNNSTGLLHDVTNNKNTQVPFKKQQNFAQKVPQNTFGIPVSSFGSSLNELDFQAEDITPTKSFQPQQQQGQYTQQGEFSQKQQQQIPEQQQFYQPYPQQKQQDIQPTRFIPNNQQFQPQQQQQYPGPNIGFNPNIVDPDNEPPLLIELGIDLESIKVRTMSVLKFKKCDVHFLEDPDLSGPIILFFIFGFFLLLSGKLHFGYIYGFGAFGTISLYCIINFLNRQKEIPLYNTLSILGYCIMPVIVLAFFNVFLYLRGFLGGILALVCVLWSTVAATNFFVALLGSDSLKYLVAYPIFLFYSIFVLITLF